MGFKTKRNIGKNLQGDEETETSPEKKETPPEESTPKGDGVASIASDAMEAAPEVSEHVISETETPAAGLTDSKETLFDPSIHAVDEAGKPLKKTNGTFQKKRGRKAGSTLSAPDRSKAEAISQEKMARATGKTLTGLYFSAGNAVVGDDFLPEDERELLHIENLFADYLTEKDMQDLPAGYALMFGLTFHAIGKSQKPKAKEKVGRIWSGLKNFFTKKKKPETLTEQAEDQKRS